MAMSLSWGNAVLEKGLDVSFADLRQVLGFTLFNTQLRAIEGKALTLREILGNPEKTARTKHRARVLAAVYGHMTSIKPRTGFSIDFNEMSIPVDYRVAAMNRVNQALKNVAAIMDQRLVSPADIEILWITTRSKTNGKIIMMNYKQLDCGFEHELIHVLERFNPNMKTRAALYFAKRTQNEMAQSLSALVPDGQYDIDEMTKVDGFFDPYVGKIYDDGYTEVNAMGVQFLFEDATLFARDFEHLLFILGQMAGR